jgi:quinolinate synthase
MAMNGLVNLAEVLEDGVNEIKVDAALGIQAKRSIQRMLDFAQHLNLQQAPGSNRDGVGPA